MIIKEYLASSAVVALQWLCGVFIFYVGDVVEVEAFGAW